MVSFPFWGVIWWLGVNANFSWNSWKDHIRHWMEKKSLSKNILFLWMMTFHIKIAHHIVYLNTSSHLFHMCLCCLAVCILLKVQEHHYSEGQGPCIFRFLLKGLHNILTWLQEINCCPSQPRLLNIPRAICFFLFLFFVS